MKRLFLAFTILYALVATTWAVEITVPAESPEHSLVRFSCDANATSVEWIIKGPRGEEPICRMGNGGMFTGPQGKYHVMLSAVEDGSVQQIWTETVIGGGVAPPFPPGPIPPRPDPPEPDPSPPGPKRVVVLYEKDALPPRQAIVLANQTWRKWVADRGHSLDVRDQNVPQANGSLNPVVAEFLPHVKGSLPVCFVASEDGSFVQVPLPSSAQGIIDFVERNGG